MADPDRTGPELDAQGGPARRGAGACIGSTGPSGADAVPSCRRAEPTGPAAAAGAAAPAAIAAATAAATGPSRATTGARARRPLFASGSVVVIGLLILAVLVSLWRQQVAREAVGQARRTMHAAQVLLAGLQGAETSQRGFVLTQDPAYLEAYRHARRSLDADAARLRALVAGQPEQVREADALEPLIAEKLAVLDDAVQRVQRDDVAGALDVVRSSRDKRSMDDIRRTIGALGEREERVLAESSRREAVDLAVLLAILLLGGAGTALFARRDNLLLARAAERAAAQARAIAVQACALELHLERLRASEAFSRRVLESSPDCVKVMSLDARLEFFSEGGLCAMEIEDFEREAKGADWLSFWRLEDRGAVRAALAEARAGGAGRFRAYCPTARGTPKWWDVSVSAIEGADGAPEKLLSVSRDVTEHVRRERQLRDALASTERARRELEFQKMALDRAAIVAVTDVAGTITYVNDKFCAISGYAREELVGRNHRLLNSRAHPAAFFKAMYAEIARGRPWQGEICNRAKDGHLYWVDTVIVPFLGDDGKPERYVAIRHDITAHKLAEQALREADARKDEFLATLAHELRNPLAPVLNGARVLARTESLGATGMAAVAMIERQTRHMKRLVDDLLEISRITRGTIELRCEPMSLDAAVRNAVETSLPAFEAKGHRLETVLPSEPLPIVGDPVRIAQVLENLLANACKYTPPGGCVRIEAVAEPDAARVSVTDDGIGIDPDKLESVFELFVQAEPGVGEHQGGLGIGLAMVRRLVRMHGGSVRADSAGRGAGATFTVRLPRRGVAA